MSCCGGNCGCGSGCKCSSSCRGCGPDVEKTPTVMLTDGITPNKKYSEGGEMMMSYGTEGGHGCSCGPNCKCSYCTC